MTARSDFSDAGHSHNSADTQQTPASAPANSMVFPNITLRDWFAGQALAGLWAAPGEPPSNAIAARVIYAIADALMAERGGAEQ